MSICITVTAGLRGINTLVVLVDMTVVDLLMIRF